MRISDWSSDVCSSDLLGKQGEYHARAHAAAEQGFAAACVAARITEAVSTLAANPIADTGMRARARSAAIAAGAATYHYDATFGKPAIGRASCRERVCKYV